METDSVLEEESEQLFREKKRHDYYRTMHVPFGSAVGQNASSFVDLSNQIVMI
jgi:hypothetical protein